MPVIRNESKKEIEELTPIKKMKESLDEPFLPAESKQSSLKNRESSLKSTLKIKQVEEEPVDIKPASLQPVQELNVHDPPAEINPTNSQLVESRVKSLLRGQKEEDIVDDNEPEQGAKEPKSMRDISVKLRDSKAGQSNVSDKQSSRVNFDSRASVMQEEDDDYINMPDITPLEMSYH